MAPTDPPHAPTAADPDRLWWRDAVVYQIYPRSFADGNGDGIGDLRGLLDHIDHLERLGIDAVWLSPIFPSPMADFGYDVSDYCAVDPVFGTLDDLDELIDALHRRGMRLLLDWVPNHTSDRHPWFVRSRSARDDPYRDWYVWRDPAPDGGPPTNWRATFGERSAWTLDPTTGQYYLHLFLPEQPDLNWANPAVEAAMHDTLRFWLDRGIDGFRADVVHLIGKGRDVDDLPAEEAAAPVLAIDRADTHARLRRIRALLDGYAHHPMMVGEVYLLGPGQTASYLGDPSRGRGELHLSFDFRPLHTRWDAGALHRVLTSGQADFTPPRWPTWVLSNHDQPRHAQRYGSEARARAAAVLSLTVRGTPFLYMGEELALLDAEVPPERTVDPAGRDGCRAPIPWTAAGDTDSGHGWPSPPWLPFPANADTHAVDVEENDPDSVLSLYRRLLALRRERAVLRRGAMTLAPLDGSVIRFRRGDGDDAITVVLNLGDRPVPIPTDVGGVLVRSAPETPDAALLAPDEAVVLGPA